jgi:EamA-like transporter family
MHWLSSTEVKKKLGYGLRCLIHSLAQKVFDCFYFFGDSQGTFFTCKFVQLLTSYQPRFFGLFGIYFSLEYLSLSDAVVLTFLSPFCTGIAGSVLLGETFTRKETFASRKHRLAQLLVSEADYHKSSVSAVSCS